MLTNIYRMEDMNKSSLLRTNQLNKFVNVKLENNANAVEYLPGKNVQL